MKRIGDTLAQQAASDQQDAEIREWLRQPFGGLVDHYNQRTGWPYLDASGAVGVVQVDKPDSDRPCSACLTGARADGGPCAGPCGEVATWRAREGSWVDTACDADAGDWLAAMRALLFD